MSRSQSKWQHQSGLDSRAAQFRLRQPGTNGSLWKPLRQRTDLRLQSPRRPPPKFMGTRNKESGPILGAHIGKWRHIAAPQQPTSPVPGRSKLSRDNISASTAPLIDADSYVGRLKHRRCHRRPCTRDNAAIVRSSETSYRDRLPVQSDAESQPFVPGCPPLWWRSLAAQRRRYFTRTDGEVT